MTNKIAIVLGGIILVLVILDLIFYGTEHAIFLGKKLFELIEWIAFWR